MEIESTQKGDMGYQFCHEMIYVEEGGVEELKCCFSSGFNKIGKIIGFITDHSPPMNIIAATSNNHLFSLK